MKGQKCIFAVTVERKEGGREGEKEEGLLTCTMPASMKPKVLGS